MRVGEGDARDDAERGGIRVREREDNGEERYSRVISRAGVLWVREIPLKAIWLRASTRLPRFPDTSLHTVFRVYIATYGTRLVDTKILLCANFSSSCGDNCDEHL
ncbi:unnamed protein product [Lasius platythorax]|uniref:Uncharacterized protein n=1 Tax=Lasius platythorax TaxID=488582 RepID=A0AAV2P598_9HYME